MKRFWEMGGVIAGVVLVAFGIGAVVIGFTGRGEVRDNVAREAIVGSPDMTPSAIKSEAAKAGLTNVDLPTCNVANEGFTTGDEASTTGFWKRGTRHMVVRAAPRRDRADPRGRRGHRYRGWRDAPDPGRRRDGDTQGLERHLAHPRDDPEVLRDPPVVRR